MKDYKVGDSIRVMYFGSPNKMIIESQADDGQWKCVWPTGQGYGSCYYTSGQIDEHEARCAAYTPPMPVSQLFIDLYTDASGNCYSDADPGL